jgi:F-type H+-transporting ATPase subunit b
MMLLALAAQAAEGGQVETIAKTFGVDMSHLMAQIISFAIVCALLYRFAYKPVLAMLSARQEQIKQGLANTEKINAALSAIEAQRQQTLAAAREEASRIVVDARQVGERIKAQETQRAAASAEQILRQAREASVLERAQMLAALRGEVGRLVVQTTAAVAGRVLTVDDQRRLAEATARQLTSN